MLNNKQIKNNSTFIYVINIFAEERFSQFYDTIYYENVIKNLTTKTLTYFR